jgi:hypothetical protein
METGGALGESGDNWLGRSGSGYVASRHLQGCSPHLCWLRIVRLAPVSKYWTYRSHAGDMVPVSWCSYVTIGPKPLSPTPGLSHGRRNEATQDDSRVSLSLVAKTSSGCRGLFRLRGLSRTGTAHRKRMPGVRGLEWEAYVACWSSFPLQGVHLFESPWLSDMSNRLFVAVFS